jgi:pSer/pThr/pTyr-binding forkhead associated (FHA) protein
MKCGQALTPGEEVADGPVEQPAVTARFRFVDPTSGTEIPLPENAKAVVGRADDKWHPDIDLPSAVAIPSRGISRKHATLEVHNGHMTIMDMRSTNGTIVNDKQIPPSVPQQLKDGDVVEIGGVTLVFHG